MPGALGSFVCRYFVGWFGAVTGNSRVGCLLVSLALGLAAVMMLLLPVSRPAKLHQQARSQGELVNQFDSEMGDEAR